MNLKFVFSFILIVSIGALAEEFQRKISLEWEEIPDAKYYDVEIQSKTGGDQQKPKSFTADKTQWTGRLTLGDYTLKVRGRDKRKVPGEWSEPQDFSVGLETPKVIAPKLGEALHSKNADERKVTFKWSPVPGSESYALSVHSKDGKIKQEVNVKETQTVVNLPVATEYDWIVTAEGPHGFHSEKSGEGQFVLWGPQLAAPNIAEPKNAFVRSLDWERPLYAENFEYIFSKWDSQKKTWVAQEKNHTPNAQVGFDEKWPGGKYKISLKATGALRQSSASSERVFNVAFGNRSPAAEEIATIRESIDRTTGWFGIASYLVTQVSYSGMNSDRTPGNQLSLNFNGALGGTGRLGAGYLSPTSAWGFLAAGEYSGIILNNNTYTFGALETDAIYRSDAGDKAEFRQQLGLFYKELPVVIGTSQSSALVQTASAIGPHYGVEYWHAITSKFGFQLNAHAYLSALSLDTPNGNSLSPTFSYQAGFLGSYRLSRRTTGLAGYALRQDSISYKANDGSTNTSAITGNYFNLFLEWQL